MNDDMQAVWQRFDSRLERLEDLAGTTAAAAALDRARRAGARARAWLVFETAVAGVTLWAIGSFAADHFADREMFVAALATGAYAIGILIGNVAQLALSRGVSYDEPVKEAQQRAELALRARTIAVMWVAVLAPLMWLPVTAVLAQAAIGVDILRGASGAWIAANLAFGVAFAAVAIAAMEALARRGKLDVVVGRILDDVTGRSLRESNAFLRQLRDE
jgi:hypothetical protein